MVPDIGMKKHVKEVSGYLLSMSVPERENTNSIRIPWRRAPRVVQAPNRTVA